VIVVYTAASLPGVRNAGLEATTTAIKGTGSKIRRSAKNRPILK
jgi:hypothetical protein